MGVLDNKLYILHGWYTTETNWKDFSSALTSYGIEPVFLKIPGLDMPIEKPWTLNDYVEWLKNTLPEGKQSNVLGHSNGGKILLNLALKYPEKLEQIFLIDSTGIAHNDIIAKTVRKIFGFFSRNRQAENKVKQSPILVQTLKNISSQDLTSELSKIKIPTVIFWGRNDPLTPFTDGLVMKNEIPRSSIYIIEKAGHSPQVTDPQHIAQVIKSEFR